MDSTPDITKTDQLTVILRYVHEGNIVERFVRFIPHVGHKAVDMEVAVYNILKDLNLDIANCRGQSYDNASNMAGIYNGLQSKIRQKNHLAYFVPCGAHSLNLVGNAAADCCLEGTSFFLFVQEIYNFFGASTLRWNLLKTELEKNNCTVPKSLSDTRWSARADACKALSLGYQCFKKVLQDISNDSGQNSIVKVKAKSLHKNLFKVEVAFLTFFWNDILSLFDKSNKIIQKVNIDLHQVTITYKSIIDYITQLRNRFDYYFEKGRNLSEFNEFQQDLKRPKTKKFKHDDGTADTKLDGVTNFKVNTYYVIIDKIGTEMQKRLEKYDFLDKHFSFITCLTELDNEDLRQKANTLTQLYKDDINDELGEECLVLKSFLNTVKEKIDISSALNLLNYIYTNDLITAFPNIYTAIHIFLTIPVSNASGERSFSILKLVKTYLRNSLGNNNLTSLALLSIEEELLQKINTDSIINEFLDSKARKWRG